MKKPQPHGAVPPSAADADSRTDFLDYRWIGPQARDFFFGLRARPEFQGLGEAVLLPAHMLSISRHPQTAGAVIEAYPNGLAYADQASFMSGAAAVGGLINLPLLVVGAWHFGTMDKLDGPGLLALALCFPVAALVFLLLRFDVIGYRCAPVLFDRAAGRVHVFTDKTRLFSVWPLWGGGPHEIQSFDWRCVRAQVGRFRTFSGNLSQDNAALTCVAIKAPDDAEVVGQFGVGTTVDAQSLQVLLDRWEHIRRFMECEGPLFAPGDGPVQAPFSRSLLGSLFWGQPLLGPGSAAFFRPWRWTMLLAQLVLLPFLPLSMAFGLIRWTTYQLKGRVVWPPDILASVGGHVLDSRELEAWRNVVPARPAAGELERRPPYKEIQDADR